VGKGKEGSIAEVERRDDKIRQLQGICGYGNERVREWYGPHK
jgi:hypothetical protein